MTDAVLAEILARLDIVVLERLPGGSFVRLGEAEPPRWSTRLLPAAGDETGAIEQTVPFLESFLPDAEETWRAGGETPLRSDPFTVTDPSGDVALVASALVVADRCFLIVESPYGFEERRQALQTAREQALAHEEHLRSTGALLTTVEATQQLTRQLATSGLTPEQQDLVAGIGQRLASLSSSIASLAPLPKGVSRGRR